MFCRLRKQWPASDEVILQHHPLRVRIFAFLVFFLCHEYWVLRQRSWLPLNVFCILIRLFGGCRHISSVETGDRKKERNRKTTLGAAGKTLQQNQLHLRPTLCGCSQGKWQLFRLGLSSWGMRYLQRKLNQRKFQATPKQSNQITEISMVSK